MSDDLLELANKKLDEYEQDPSKQGVLNKA